MTLTSMGTSPARSWLYEAIREGAYQGAVTGVCTGLGFVCLLLAGSGLEITEATGRYVLGYQAADTPGLYETGTNSLQTAMVLSLTTMVTSTTTGVILEIGNSILSSYRNQH